MVETSRKVQYNSFVFCDLSFVSELPMKVALDQETGMVLGYSADMGEFMQKMMEAMNIRHMRCHKAAPAAWESGTHRCNGKGRYK